MLHRIMQAAALVSCAAAYGTAQAQPLDCVQANAIYADGSGAYELRFQPINSEAAAASGRFHVKVAGLGLAMDGFVMPAEDPLVSDGILMFDCSQGDATGAEIAACTVWQGRMHGTGPGGLSSNLQAENAEAARSVVLPGLGKSIRSSRLWAEGRIAVAPEDVLTFKECAG